jgi:hypothetical protein
MAEWTSVTWQDTELSAGQQKCNLPGSTIPVFGTAIADQQNTCSEHPFFLVSCDGVLLLEHPVRMPVFCQSENPV